LDAGRRAVEPAAEVQEALPARERKAHFGELVQLEGSFHDWLEGRGARRYLMDMVNDATGRTVARLGKERRSGRRWECCGPVEQYGCAAGALHGLEERV